MAADRSFFATMVLRAVTRRRAKSLMAVFASTVGAATLLCLALICLVVPAQMSAELRSYGANLVVNASGGLSDAEAAAVEAKVRAVAPAASARYRYESVRINAAPYTLGGIDADAVRAINRHWSVDGDWPSGGAVMVGRDVASALGLKVGSTVTMALRSDDEDDATLRNGRRSTDILAEDGQRMRVAGILDTGGAEDGLVYMDADDLDGFAGARGVDVIEFASEADGDALGSLAASLRDASTGVQAHQVSRMTSSNQRIVTMLRVLFVIVSVVALALTLVGVSTTMRSIVASRRAEIGLRRALGAPGKSVAGEFFVESALYGLVGGVLGAAVGYAIARVLCEQVFGRTVGFVWRLGIGCVLVAVALAVVASIGPVRAALRIDPAVVLREE